MLQKFRGIVLRARDYGESNQIIQIFSESAGKFSFMARGSKKPKSRFSAITEPFTEAQFICYLGSGMATLSQGDLINAHQSIRSDLLKTAYAAYWFEWIDRLLGEKEPFPQLYRLLLQLLVYLEKDRHPEMLTRIFELRMLNIAGYRPVFQHCVNCRSQSLPVRVSVIQGGFLCSECWQLDPRSLSISEAVAKILPLLQEIDLRRLGKIQVRVDTEQQVKRVVKAFTDEYIEGEFKTRKMIDQLKD